MADHEEHAQHHDHEAHHIEEFGSIEFIEEDVQFKDDSTASHLRRLRKRVMRKRHLQQHFAHKTLYRTAGTRTVSQDELFLDLIIVANLAAFGHELRYMFKGWLQLEKFFLLFGAVCSSWRALVMYWNLWGVTGDLFDKITVYVTFTLLTIIGAGAHGAFTVARPYVAVASFLATTVPLLANAIFAEKEELLVSKDNVMNQPAFFSVCQVLATMPYLAAAFVKSATTARILFWIPPSAQILMTLFTMDLYKIISRKKADHTTMAVNIELFAEKYEVLTLIVLGESLIAILFEAASFITVAKARIEIMFLAVVGCTSLIYALQTLYVNVDNKILRGGKHSMRHNVVLGVTWTAMHTPYHICLVLLATGLGIAFRDIIITPAAAGSASSARSSVGEAAHFVVRAAAKLTAPGVPHFTKLNRWLFSIGWGGSMLLSAMLSMMHFKGPRETTKYPRVLLRSAIAIGLGVGMPFTGVPAGVYLLVHSLVTSVISFTEFILVQVDAVDIIGSTLRGYDLDDAAHSDHSDHGIKAAAAGDENSPWPDTEAQKQRGEETINAQALRRRMSQKGRHRLEKVDVSNTKVYEQFSPRSLL